jgi:rhomboid protease GluP
LRSLGHDLGFVPFVTGTCIVMYVITLLWGGTSMSGGAFGILSPSDFSLLVFGASGAAPVFGYHRWWTVLSAGWLHAGLLHIAFNLMWIRQLAPAVAELYGPGRMVIIYTVGGVVGFVASTLAGFFLTFMPLPNLRGGQFTVGASAAIFGLLGALVYYGRRSGSSLIRGQALSWAMMGFVFGLLMPGIDNYAHAGGFVGGYLTGRLLDPLQPERVNHMVGALVCLAISILAIVVSVLHAYMV